MYIYLRVLHLTKHNIMKKEMIIQNEAECKKCGDIIWSAHTHDFKSCECGAISVDGGMEYIRRVGDSESVEDRSLSTDRDTMLDCVGFVESSRDVTLEIIKELSFIGRIKEFVFKTLDKRLNIAIAYSIANYYVLGGAVIIYLKKDIEKACIAAVKESRVSGRNSFGITLAVIRALRDNDCLDMSKFNQE